MGEEIILPSTLIPCPGVALGLERVGSLQPAVFLGNSRAGGKPWQGTVNEGAKKNSVFPKSPQVPPVPRVENTKINVSRPFGFY